LLDLIKIEEQKGNCRDIYQDKNTNRLYCRHLNNRYSKGVYVNFWNTFNGYEPDCPLKNETEIKIGDQLFVIERDEWSGWAIERLFQAENNNTFEQDARRAFWGGQGSQVLSEAYPGGCNLAEAIHYFKKHGEEFKALGLI
jgi:hypothetical protein